MIPTVLAIDLTHQKAIEQFREGRIAESIQGLYRRPMQGLSFL